MTIFLRVPTIIPRRAVWCGNDLRRSENKQLKQRLGKHEIVWQGAVMQRVMAQLDRVAASETRVCILGETGTGKELVARTIHERSGRAAGAFVTLNCAAVPADSADQDG